MKKQISVVLAAALGVVVFAGQAAAQSTGSVVVGRGAATETVHFDNRGGVSVARGQPAAKPVARVHKVAYSGAHASSRRVIAGDTVWIVDSETKRLVACELRYTTQVGGRKIRCRSKRLR